MTGASITTAAVSVAAATGPVPGADSMAMADAADWHEAIVVAPTQLGVVGEMLSFPFMQRALVAGLCIGAIAPLIGTFLVHRRLALIGDALAHTAFAGVALGLFLGSIAAIPVSPYVTALVVAVLAGLCIQLISEYTDAYGDVSMAIVLSGGFALGTVLVTMTDGGISIGIDQYLFGNLSTIDTESTWILVGLSLLVIGVVAVTYKQLLYVAFDETAARVAGIDVTWYNRLTVMLTALVVVAAMQIMGVILVVAMLVVPVAAATQIAGSFKRSLLLAVGIGEIAVVSGLTLSYLYGLATGGIIVLCAIGVFAGCALAGRSGIAR